MIFVLHLFCDAVSDLLHTLRRELQFLAEKVHVTFLLDRNEVDVCVRTFKPHYGNSDAFARDRLSERFCHALGK